jgi:ParB family chromosome partitioning protein
MDELSTMDSPAAADGVGSVRRRLGRGLHALLGGSHDEPMGEQASMPATTASTADPSTIHVDLIERNPFQPRKDFEAESLSELVESIRQHGILQPLLVRPYGGQYQLIAGERRLMAAREAGLETVPCRVLEFDDRRVCEAAIEENLKRKDLNVLEKAQAFQDYLTRFDSTIDELAKQLSMNRSTVTNYIRLLELPNFVKTALASDRITNGHARALLTLDEGSQIALCKRIEAESLSVRKTEEAVRELQQQGDGQAETIPFPATAAKGSSTQPSNHVLQLQQQLRDLLGTKVEIRQSGKDAGKIIIPFQSNDEFEHILRQLRHAA